MKIGIYGTGAVAKEIIEYSKNKNIQISFFVQTDAKQREWNGKPVIGPSYVDYKSVDYLVLSSDLYMNEMRTELRKQQDDYESNLGKIISFEELLSIVESGADYRIVTVEKGISFLYTKQDVVIGPTMERTHKTWGSDVIENLLAIAEKEKSFCRDGYYLDIGANIGTTTVYLKRIRPEMRVIAFEPGRKNFDLLKVNCIINEVEGCVLENVGLGEKQSEGFFYYRGYNPGGSMIFENKTDIAQDSVSICTLADYVKRNDIDISKISFIWMDTEGFEAEIIIGAKDVLYEKAIPMVHEFDPEMYIKKNKALQYLEIMRNTYNRFIDVNKLDIEAPDIRPIGELEKLLFESKRKTDLFFF